MSNSSHHSVSSSSPYEPRLGIAGAVRLGALIAIGGTAPLAQMAKRSRQVTRFADPDWLIEIEADAYYEEEVCTQRHGRSRGYCCSAEPSPVQYFS